MVVVCFWLCGCVELLSEDCKKELPCMFCCHFIFNCGGKGKFKWVGMEGDSPEKIVIESDA